MARAKHKSSSGTDVISLRRTISNRTRQRGIIQVQSNNPVRGPTESERQDERGNPNYTGENQNTEKTGKARL